ncbi:MAG: S-methyl-5-thioribose-1-phosphate isomerase [Candidatus Heimdallarchaeota archaeon]|nr:MAG: S-methyl-5-thioribose-1-phosphate isomerase [Candidatus Heimdallarchaeota archaeon]
MIDQTKLPFSVEIYTCPTYRETAFAVKKMIIRGAPSIGAAAAYGLAQAVHEFWESDSFEDSIKVAYDELLSARPTAVDLKNGLDFIRSTDPFTPENVVAQASLFAKRTADQGLKIGQIGKELITNNMNILTHCHTGALALVDHGSALAPIIQAWQDGKRFHVFVDETRPRFQGRITAWELSQYGIDHTVICDSMSGFFMSRGEIDLVILGADRVTRNGDIANKIGTYNLAILAQYHNIPFYTAFPTSTFDPSTKSGKDIEIEKRNDSELKIVEGISNIQKKSDSISIFPDFVKFKNPAFDVTPNKLITGYITPYGILTNTQLVTFCQ